MQGVGVAKDNISFGFDMGYLPLRRFVSFLVKITDFTLLKSVRGSDRKMLQRDYCEICGTNDLI